MIVIVDVIFKEHEMTINCLSSFNDSGISLLYDRMQLYFSVEFEVVVVVIRIVTSKCQLKSHIAVVELFSVIGGSLYFIFPTYFPVSLHVELSSPSPPDLNSS